MINNIVPYWYYCIIYGINNNNVNVVLLLYNPTFRVLLYNEVSFLLIVHTAAVVTV